MLFRTHIAFGIFIYLLIMSYVDSKIIFFVFLLLGVVITDIDSRKSKVGKKWYFRPFQWAVRHRGVFHSLICGLALSIIITIFHRWAGIGFFIGYLSHLLLDCLTRQGIKLFWPFSKWRIKGPVRSGKITEDIIFVLLLLADIFIVGKMVFYYLF